jgi:glycosyltransferase involved in cell wall biosynthesis
MKILHIIPSLAKGGAERIVIDTCVELTKRGIDVQLVTLREENEYKFLTPSISHTFIPSAVIPSLTGKMQLNVAALQKYIDSYQPDIIHSHLFESEIVLSQINFPNALYFVHFHDNMNQFLNFGFSTILSKENITNYYEKIEVLKAYKKRRTEFIAISNDSFNYIKSTVPRKYKKTLLPNSIDTNRFLSNNEPRDPLKIITIGSLVVKKGQELAIEVIAKLHEKRIYATLDILGDGPNLQLLKNKADKYHLNKYITFHGNVNYPEDVLKQATVYLHTAIYEPFGLVLLEAMAAGLPVVCTDAKGNRELIIEGKNGFMLTDRDPAGLAQKIELLIKDASLYDKMSLSAISFSKNYDIKNYVNNLLDVYNRAQ